MPMRYSDQSKPLNAVIPFLGPAMVFPLFRFRFLRFFPPSPSSSSSVLSPWTTSLSSASLKSLILSRASSSISWSSSSSLCCQTLTTSPPPLIIRPSVSKPNPTTPSTSSWFISANAFLPLISTSRILPLPIPTATISPNSSGTALKTSRLSYLSTTTLSSPISHSPCFHIRTTPLSPPTAIFPPTAALLSNSSSRSSLCVKTPFRRSVTAMVVPPVLTHCLENPPVDLLLRGSGEIEDM